MKNHPYKDSINKSGYTVINCKKCGYWHVYPIPTEEEMDVYYESKYFETLGDNRTMTDKLGDPDNFYKIQYEDRLRRLIKLFPSDMPKTVLDIGSGYGDFLRFIKSHGWETQGLEPSRHAYELIKDKEVLNIAHGSIDSLLNPKSNPQRRFKPSSVVTLNNVLEHLREPQRILRIIRQQLLLPKGILLIVVPNDFNILQELLMKTVLKNNTEKQYYWLGLPDHLNYWSPETIKKLLVKLGFRILYFTVEFPMEIFPLMGEDYITHIQLGKSVHLKRVQFEKYLYETNSHDLKDKLFESFARIGIGRDMQIFATIQELDKK